MGIADYLTGRFDGTLTESKKEVAMFRMLAIATLLALALPTLAMAQPHEEEEHRRPPPGPGGPPHPPPPRPAFVPHGPPAHGPVVGPHPGPMAGPHPGPVIGPHGPLYGPGQFSFRGHNFNRVHLNPFIYPPGWAYRQWAIGAVLPPLFLARDYYYPEWAALGLEPPPPGTQWVRYGPDLLLVDVTTGQVIDVAYGVFYE